MGCRAVTWASHQMQPEREKVCKGRQGTCRVTWGEAEPLSLSAPVTAWSDSSLAFLWIAVSLEAIQKGSNPLALPSPRGSCD